MKTLRNAFALLYRRYPMLAVVSLAHLLVGAVLLTLIPFDSRQVMGINPWIKPVKFYLSSAVYLGTLAVLLPYLNATHPKAVRFVGWTAAAMLMAENVGITLQAARGVGSHFNVGSAFDGRLFSAMGVFILINTLVVIYATWLFFRTSPAIPRPYLWGIRLGLVLFLVGSAVGGMMIRLTSHNVGVAMGGHGLPFTNWSTRGGDLRIAHFIGLHALQVVPLAGYLVARYVKPAGSFRPVAYTVGIAALYTALTGFLFWQAMNGVPLVAGR
ncbi:MAG: hypothetical protein H7Z75_20995 [Ferruginibacter sp.]|nr:hypothetical protein [Cytophagales bacterium]